MNYSSSNNNGISPTVGVILMVAITVVLAVTVGAMVLDIGEETSQNAQAGVTMQETNNGVEVKVNSFGGNTDELEVLVNGTVEKTITSVGTYDVLTGSGAVVSVRGVTESGEESVVQSVTVSKSGGADYFSAPNSSELATIHSNMTGNGSSGKPYLITNIYELQAMNADLTANYTLGNNIDASITSRWNNGKGFNPIGEWGNGNGFTGSLDGNGYEVRGLTINRSKNSIGLIGVMNSSGSVSNVGVVNSDITGNSFVGGLVGYNGGDSVSESYATGSVNGTDSGGYVGGLVGWNDGSVSNSYATGSVSGSGDVGGLVGNNDVGSVSVSYWDTESTGQSSGIGTDQSDEGTTNNVGLTTSEMQGDSASENMTAFDFGSSGNWTIVTGDYPELQEQNESS